MAGTLALIGGGETSSQKLLAEILGGVDELLVIPTAAAMERPAGRIEALRSSLADTKVKLEIVDVLRRADAERSDIVERVQASDAFLILDGSPLHLRSVLKGSAMFGAIAARHESGALLAASGAGASVLCDPMIDPRGGAYTVGLGIANGLALITDHSNCPPHLLARSLDLLPETATLVGIDSSTALIRDSAGAWRVAGSGIVTVYEGRGSTARETFAESDAMSLS